MKTYKYILLDWDGNIAKTLDIWLEACRAPLVKRGLHLSDEEIAASFGSFTKFITKWGFADERDEIFDEADAIAKQMLPSVEFYPDAIEVLEDLHTAGKKLALITTSPHENIQHILEAHNMHRFFDVIVAHEDTVEHKPHAEPLEKGIELLGGTKDESIMVGDSDKDLGAAQNAGVDSALFYPEEHKKFYNLDQLKEHNPTFIMSDFRELIKIAGV